MHVNINDIAQVCNLLDTKEKANHADKNGWTFLIHTSMLGYLEASRHLIELGADVNYVCPLQWTALLLACGNRHYDVIRLLIDNGADVNARCNNGMTPIVLLMVGNSSNEEERYKTLEYLIEKGASTEDARRWHGQNAEFTRYIQEAPEGTVFSRSE